MKTMKLPRHAIVYLLLAALALAPWGFSNRYIFHLATMITIMMPMALSLNLTLKMGQLSLAQPAFMGIGAYGSALLTMRLGLQPMVSLFVGALVAALIALLTGPIFLRIKGVYFALLTFAFGQIVNLVFQEWTSLFGGNGGLYGVPKLSVVGFRLTTVQNYYIIGLFFATLCYAAMRVIERSDIGAIIQSLNEDETLSRSLGGNALAWRVAAFTFSAFVAGLSGGLYAHYIGFLSPDPFGFRASVDLIVMNVIGGSSSALGPLLGAIAIVPLPEVLREAREYQLLIYGVCLVVFQIFVKKGLVSLIERNQGAA